MPQKRRGRAKEAGYLYEELHSGESAEQVLARAEGDGAPFVDSAECRPWGVEEGLRELSEDSSERSNGAN